MNTGGRPRPPSRPDDWKCATCSYENFASRKKCKRCGISRDGSVADVTSHDGNVDGASNGRNNDRPTRRAVGWKRENPIGYKALEKLLEESPDQVVLQLQMEKSGYLCLLEDPSNTNVDKMCLLMQVLALASNARSNRESLNMLLIKTFQSKFTSYLMSFSLNILMEKVPPTQMVKYFQDLSIVLEKFSHAVTNIAVNSIFVLVEGCLMYMKQREPDQCREIIESFDEIKNFLEVEKKKWQPQKQKKSNYRRGHHELSPPPNDFRELPVIPTSVEINETETPYFRPNIIVGKYKNVDHYLDVQFRLLREDFVRPLREGIQDLKLKGKSRNRDLYVYKDVKVLGSEIKNYVMIHNVKLNLPESFKAENSKRLLFGNLICFSCDNFKTLLFGSVAERKPEMLKKGILGIKFDSEVQNISCQNFTMVESRSYFVAYKYVLKALQKITIDTFPMEEFFVHVHREMPLPNYLDHNAQYDLQVILNKSMMKSSEVYNPLFEQREEDFERHVYIPALRNVSITDDLLLWPACEELQLDMSQRSAIRNALTSKLSVIQGPPGTGKTFLGLKIAQVLLHNSQYWKDDEKKSPILVVCFTNHALDQFLEGMVPFTKSLVRIGSRTKSELIQPYQINFLLKNLRARRVLPEEIHQNRIDIMQRLNELQTEIMPWKGMVSQLRDPIGILKINCFLEQNVIPDQISRIFQGGLMNLEKFLLDAVFCQEIKTKVAARPSFGDQDDKNVEPDEEEEFWQNAEEHFAAEEETRRLDDDFDEHRGFVGKPQDVLKYCITLELLEKELNNLEKKKKISSGRLTLQLLNEMEQIENKWKLLYYGLNIALDIEKAEALERSNIWRLTVDERWLLYKLWLHRLAEKVLPKLTEMEAEFERTSAALNEVRDYQFLHIMSHAAVVGMTTTGAAQYSNILRALAPTVVIIEEAAEILEAHVVTALTEECEHLIMIGDHQQLQPSATVYELATDYGLETSLFERLINNGIAYETLKYQHRMRPNISRLLVPSIYRELKDHKSVELYPHVRGMQRDVFFVTHRFQEKNDEDGSNSKENTHEANFIMALCRHLMLQGYSSGDITVLTPYTGQFFLLKKIQRKFDECQGVRVSVVDNFQGEESNIILLSLVRSNEGGAVGFLKKKNRICVALSRAKHGLYVIGNMKQLRDSCDVWKQIFKSLSDDNAIGTSINLLCENHQVLSQVSNGEEFIQKSPEGGCTKPCSVSLQCGHICPKICHMTDLKHKSVKCPAPCHNILCERNHPCPKKCWETCMPCIKLVLKEFPCGHVHNVQCSRYDLSYRCPTIIARTLPDCHHNAEMKCFQDPGTFPCPTPCVIRLPCGHSCTRKCHVKDDPRHLTYKCEQTCPRSPEGCSQPQDHKCMRACYEACGPCFVTVKKRAVCGHLHDVQCSTPREEIVCNQKCKRLLPCSHHCPRKCKDPCGGCCVRVKKKIAECQHEIEVECGKPARRENCSSPCIGTLRCGHKCQEKCKDPCTNNCKVRVLSANKCPKDHLIKVPCYCRQAVKGEDAWIYCMEPCGAELDCGHFCKGNCGSCLHGRLHVACSENCERSLVCGHICKENCSTSCPPCQDPCPMKCVHSRCAQKCGEPCNPCQERCSKQCVHQKCTNPCGRKCTNLCEEPCPKKLKCGHECVGFCGDPCPPLCRVCNKEELTEILFGSEDEEDARFVLLEDCGHVIEADGLESWLSQDIGEIGMKFCPRCKRPIYNNQRYQEAIFAAYENVRKVKNRYYLKKPRQAMKELQDLWSDMEGLEGKEVEAIKRKVPQVSFSQIQQVYRNVSDDQISLYHFQVQILKKISHILESHPGYKDNLANYLKIIKKQVMKQNHHISPQMMEEISCELQRLNVLPAYWEFNKKIRFYKRADLTALQIQLGRLMDPTAKFNSETEEKVKQLLKKSEKYIGGLGISDEERVSILEAMGLKQGHWYKCPKGHIYCITECGGAMVEASCPECGATIGGGSHTLRSDNQVATEMDGAQHPAWSEHYNDMENFRFDD